MSILVQDNATPTLSVPDFFPSAQGFPFAFATFIKVSGWSTSGYYATEFLRFGLATDKYALETRRNLTSRTWMATPTETGSTDNLISPELGAEAEDNWMPVFVVFASATSRTIYTRFDNGTLQQTTETASLSPQGVVDLSFFPVSIGDGPMRLAHVACWQAAPNATQVEEYMDTGSIAGLTPYSMWRATTDWGAGAITDEGSSGTDITPPAGWTYSADNPAIQAAVPGIPSDTIRFEGIPEASTDYDVYVWAGTMPSGSATEYSITTDGSGVFPNLDITSSGVSAGDDIYVLFDDPLADYSYGYATTAGDIS